jgi:ankyrin repeat protein
MSQTTSFQNLLDACRDGDLDRVILLLQRHDIDVNGKCRFGCTALHWACCNGRTAVVHLLLQRDDIHVNAQDRAGWTPLHEACRNGRTAVVHLLLQRPDIDVNAQDHNGRTPLHEACHSGHTAIINRLLRRSAQPFHEPFDDVKHAHLDWLARLSRRHQLLEKHPSSPVTPQQQCLQLLLTHS